jgi:hypothetical protein
VKDNALQKLDSVVLELDSYRKNGESYRSRIDDRLNGLGAEYLEKLINILPKGVDIDES